tara:strand:+ start:1163 stop:1372 length:210 start_codon:yes stop_codon:yes gene_type:complete
VYVCICNGHRDRDLREAAAGGIRCALQAYDSLGGAPRCGQCLEVAQQIIDEAHELSTGAATPALGTQAA